MSHTIERPDSLDNLRLELRRGCLPLAVLAALVTEQYGYSLRKLLASRGLDMDESTLYPLLRRLEAQGLLLSEWREHEKRNKRFYRISPTGQQVLTQLTAEWSAMNRALESIIDSATADKPSTSTTEDDSHGTD